MTSSENYNTQYYNTRMSDLHFVELSERAYKYIRQFTIKSTEDALVELITNSIDAYNKTTKESRKLEIEFQFPNKLRVRDFALGLTGDEMQACFLQVGTYTSTAESRGFFSRGAKDISAIGDITFQTIKDGKYSLCVLNSDAYGAVPINSIDATDEHRADTKIPENGLVVTINLLDNFIVKNPSDEAESISKLTVLRDIMTDEKNVITYSHLSVEGVALFNRTLKYAYPDGSLLLDLTYNVPFYDNVEARFVVYKSQGPMPQPKKENEISFGFLLKSNTTVYEGNTIDDRFRWNPYMNVLYGYLQCDNIDILLKDYDINGATQKNPMPIIDPSRLTGLNREHPFIESLLSIPKVRLDHILRELNQTISKKSISIKEVDQIFDELSKYGLDIIEEEEITVSFVPSYDAELAKAIEDDRLNYVRTEANYLLTKNYTSNASEIDEYMRERIIRIEPEERTEYVYALGEDNELVQIPNSTDTTKNEPVNIEQLLESEDLNLTKRPYIYKMSSTGDLMKLYIFDKGRIENITNPENEYIKMKNKKFQISFINDINMIERYRIEHADGLHIKLNVNNDSIKKYLADTIARSDENFTMDNLTLSSSLVFLNELVIEILSEIILENDIINNRLILDSNTLNNTRKINNHRAKIEARIEVPINKIFQRYLAMNKEKKSLNINTILEQITDVITSKYGGIENVDGNLLLLKSNLDNTLSSLIE